MSTITTSGRAATVTALERATTPTTSVPSSGEALSSGITVTGVTKSFGHGARAVRALSGVDLAVASGEFVSLVGASGCGKSTLLRIVAGLDEPSEGRVQVGAPSGAAALPGAMAARDRLTTCAYMPQRDMLLPWRTVLDNAALPLEYQGLPRRAARREASRLLEQFGVGGFDHAWPAALSGGMRQRVALARTALTGRRALLLDEPFGALDALTRLEMQGWLLEVWMRLGVTVLLVTHDLDEAIYLSDRVYVMGVRPGRIVDEVVVALPRPRGEEIVATPEFARLKGRLLAAIRGAERGEGRKGDV
jgi:ABC-type nitrate/sulfonate/bicarbonate transport system ATPase subunit